MFLFAFSVSLHAQQDTIPPFLVCHNNLSVNLPANCALTIWATDFIDASVPNHEYNYLQFGIRRRCAGTGFPENTYSLDFSVCELGLVPIEVWARDTAGNTSSCHINVIIQSPAGSCDPFNYLTTNTPSGNGIVHTKIDVLGIIPEFPHKQSWRYVVKDYTFPNPANPFNPPFPESYVVPFTDDGGYYSIHFIGVKIGDVNFSVDPTQ